MRRTLLVALVVLPFAVALEAQAQTAPRRSAPDLATAKVVDLTHSFDKDTLYWPTSPSAFELKPLADGKTPGGWFYRSNAFCTPEHGGTHLDAPSHFSKDGLAADKIPVRQLIAPAAVIDVRAQAAKDTDYRLALADVQAWEKAHGPMPAGTIVLLRTGWSTRWPDRKAYLGDDTPGDASKLHFPSYGEEAAKYLVSERKVGALGVDTASIDYGASKDFVVHVIANGANVFGLENVTNLDSLPEWGAWVVALPMKIAGGSGGPLRIVALLP
jgi:kynurenine formamidase